MHCLEADSCSSSGSLRVQMLFSSSPLYLSQGYLSVFGCTALLHFFWKLEIIKMDLVSWSLNAIDKIFSTMRMGEGAPGCPSGTEPAGHFMDSWKQWNLICLSQLYVEDSEDVWIFVVLVSGFLLFGLSGYLVYRKIYELSRNIGYIPELRDGLHRAVNAQTHIIVEMSRKLGTLAEIQTLAQKVDSITERVDGTARIGID
nr:uncharacterized protein LOC129163696 [Nothobranchius furzeri]